MGNKPKRDTGKNREAGSIHKKAALLQGMRHKSMTIKKTGKMGNS
jgi:hypothetical protein